MTDYRIRIWRVVYRSANRRRRVRVVVVKVPYGGAFAMTELLTRMVAVGQVIWFQAGEATSEDIAWAKAQPGGLQRWMPALVEQDTTGVDWTA